MKFQVNAVVVSAYVTKELAEGDSALPKVLKTAPDPDSL
jgi:hypothetical protein